MTRALTKHTIIIWTETDEATYDLEDLAREAMSGGAYCADHMQEIVEKPLDDEHAPGEEFFQLEEDEDGPQEATASADFECDACGTEIPEGSTYLASLTKKFCGDSCAQENDDE